MSKQQTLRHFLRPNVSAEEKAEQLDRGRERVDAYAVGSDDEQQQPAPKKAGPGRPRGPLILMAQKPTVSSFLSGIKRKTPAGKAVRERRDWLKDPGKTDMIMTEVACRRNYLGAVKALQMGKHTLFANLGEATVRLLCTLK